MLVSAHSCHFGGVYTCQVWESRSVQFLRYSGVTRTHKQTFFQTIYSNPPEGGGSMKVYIGIYYISKLKRHRNKIGMVHVPCNKIKHHFHITTVDKYCFSVFCLYSSYIYLCTVVMWMWCLILLLRNHPNLVRVFLWFWYPTHSFI